MSNFLAMPWFYNFFQAIIGENIFRERLVKEFIRPKNGDRILDIGCGTGGYLKYLLDYNIDYLGFDESASYIQYAQQKYKNKQNVRFFCQKIDLQILEKIPKFDIVLCMGVQHHLKDQELDMLIKLASGALKSGGRLVTMDPCLYQDMNLLEWLLTKYDRGSFVRTEKEYSIFLSKYFKNISVRSQILGRIPARAAVGVAQESSIAGVLMDQRN